MKDCVNLLREDDTRACHVYDTMFGGDLEGGDFMFDTFNTIKNGVSSVKRNVQSTATNAYNNVKNTGYQIWNKREYLYGVIIIGYCFLQLSLLAIPVITAYALPAGAAVVSVDFIRQLMTSHRDKIIESIKSRTTFSSNYIHDVVTRITANENVLSIFAKRIQTMTQDFKEHEKIKQIFHDKRERPLNLYEKFRILLTLTFDSNTYRIIWNSLKPEQTISQEQGTELQDLKPVTSPTVL